MKLLYLLLPVAMACSPELMIYDARHCRGATRSKGITVFKAYKDPIDKFPSGCSYQTVHGRRIAQFVPGKRVSNRLLHDSKPNTVHVRLQRAPRNPQNSRK